MVVIQIKRYLNMKRLLTESSNLAPAEEHVEGPGDNLMLLGGYGRLRRPVVLSESRAVQSAYVYHPEVPEMVLESWILKGTGE